MMTISGAARVLLFSVLLISLFVACSPSPAWDDASEKMNNTDKGIPEVELLFCKGQSILPVLLTTGQIDGYVAWQPYLALAEKSGIGKVVALSRDFPPDGIWHNHPCCVLVASNDILQNYPDMAMAVSAVLLSGDDFAKEHPEALAEITADWLMGDEDYLLGNQTISPVSLFKRSLSTSVFSSQANEEWNGSAQILLDRMGDILNTIDNAPHNGSDTNLSTFMDSRPYISAAKWIASQDRGSSYSSNNNKHAKNIIRIGYLMIDHQAPLFAAVKNWPYFQQKYGIALKSVEGLKRPRYLELMINGKKAADVELISAPTGQNLMTLMEQNNLDMAIVGITPAIGSISLGCEARIIQPVQNLGSGLVLATASGAEDWNDFVSLAEVSFANGRPLKIGDPDLGTITDVIFQDALRASGLRGVRASGT
ncbi:MAG: ABC transporter substrate-binding protein [Methanothrix sp.]|nr:ABC transporter substrate-binding protein [Methanothrix sp.]